LDRAQGRKYDEQDRHLLNVFLAGDERGWGEFKTAFPEIWDAVTDVHKVNLLEEHPLNRAVCEWYDKHGKYAPGSEFLTDAKTLSIRHTAPIKITTKGELLTRGVHGGVYTKVGDGGGKHPKTPIHCIYSCREGMEDESGVPMSSRAYRFVSPPMLCVQIKHKGKNAKLAKGEPYSLVWVQVFVFDDDMIKETDEHLVDRGYPPDTAGQWGHFEVDGVPLECPELGRYAEGKYEGWARCAFCLEDWKSRSQIWRKDRSGDPALKHQMWPEFREEDWKRCNKWESE